MKNSLKNWFPLFLGLMLVFLMTSCKEKLYNQLEGDWAVTSYKVDGVEAIGVDLESFTIEFDDYDTDGEEGDYSWNFTYSDGTSESYDGTYEVDTENNEVTFNFDAPFSGSYDFEVEIDGDELTLQGDINGFAVDIEAERD